MRIDERSFATARTARAKPRLLFVRQNSVSISSRVLAESFGGFSRMAIVYSEIDKTLYLVTTNDTDGIPLRFKNKGKSAIVSRRGIGDKIIETLGLEWQGKPRYCFLVGIEGAIVSCEDGQHEHWYEIIKKPIG